MASAAVNGHNRESVDSSLTVVLYASAVLPLSYMDGWLVDATGAVVIVRG